MNYDQTCPNCGKTGCGGGCPPPELPAVIFTAEHPSACPHFTYSVSACVVCQAATIADLHAQLAAVTAERDEAVARAEAYQIREELSVTAIQLAAAIRERDEARAFARDNEAKWLGHHNHWNDLVRTSNGNANAAIARAEAAEAKLAAAKKGELDARSQVAGYAQDADDWRRVAEAAERVVEAARRVLSGQFSRYDADLHALGDSVAQYDAARKGDV